MLAGGFGVLGYILYKLRCEPAPLLLGFILGPMVEENLRRALLISRGDPTVFFTRPISLSFLILTALLVLLLVAPSLRVFRKRAFDEPAT
jgi:TctA family transporter